MNSFLTMIVGTPNRFRHPSARVLALPMLASLGVGYELSSSSNLVTQAGSLLLLSLLGLQCWRMQRQQWTKPGPAPASVPAMAEPASKLQNLSSRVLQACGDAVVVSDGLDRIVMVNPAFLAMTGLSPSEVMGHSAELLGMAPLRDSHLNGVRSSLEADLRWSGESAQTCADGQQIDTCLTVTALRNEASQITQHIRTFNDITPLKQQQRVLAEQARHDSLTGLPNRRAFGERLQQAMSRARRQPQTLAVLYVDLDGFKSVNDLHGHAVGDQLLVEVGQRLDACVRLTDCVCRLSGDEFTVILEGAGHPDEVQRVGNRMLERLSLPHCLKGQSMVVTPSIGGTLFILGDNASTLCQRADETMYEAKRSGKARFILNLLQPELQHAQGT
ncbi:sensor domain-containing diguanylate cyclase [Aquabacterium sp.]|uniref:sensor domain-containing diguanylate cyclase n=1 Tax=Aquabacterium sp. TaxID=1872578 RepID=UPI0019B18C7A|nr:sensor domain-containing diguanylate cyclase [Aquabacterium sp.]MBC7698791.1 sensor domain-containing diguanylate cyclase [Aquabacterium sp.]